jgi:3-hydroxybutyryl-CoA dehydrogenase
MEIKAVGVVGCGLMGSGIVETCARVGYQVVVREPNETLLAQGLARLKGSLAKAVDRGKLPQADADAAMARIRGTIQLEGFASCDLVIEAAVENMSLKKEVFASLDKICPAHAILASNTSSLCVMEMASVTKRQDKILGMHFFNPVPVMKLLEFVRTIATSEETMETARQFGASLNKTMITAKDTPGFIVNVLLVPFMLDAVRILENGVATKEDIDAGMQLGCNHPMGPLTLADFVGLDTALFIADAMYDEFKDARYAAPPLLRRMVLAGWLGRKTGRGFYSYA